MRAQVRDVLNEATPRFWLDSEINVWLNEAAALMTSEAKCLTGFYQTATTIGQQEYALPEDVTEIFSASYSNNINLPITPLEEAVIKAGARVQGIPMWCYFRLGALQFANTSAANDIAVTDIPLQGRRKPQFVIGLYPIPSSTQNLTIGYYQRHWVMIADTDESAIPDEYIRGVVAYAAGLGKLKEQAIAEHDRQMQVFKEFKDRFAEKMANNGNLIGFPRIKIPGRGGGDTAGSSWIYVGDATYSP